MRLNTFTHFPQTPAITFGGKLARRAHELEEKACLASDAAFTARQERKLAEARPILDRVYMEFTDAQGQKDTLTGLDVLEELRDLTRRSKELKNGSFLEREGTNIMMVSLDTILKGAGLTQTDGERAHIRQALGDLIKMELVHQYSCSGTATVEDYQCFLFSSGLGDLALEKAEQDCKKGWAC